jgi:hypothetical protein
VRGITFRDGLRKTQGWLLRTIRRTFDNIAWIDAVIAARLPLAPGAPLRAISVTDGWLGDRSSGAISTYACFGATRPTASWLPSGKTALDWQRMARGTVVVAAC